MKIPPEIIAKAIEGGYTNFPFVLLRNPESVWVDGEKIVAARKDGDWKSQAYLTIKEVLEDWHRIALDPSFWIALGKALGDDDFTDKERPYIHFANGTIYGANARAHHFYHLILTSGDTDAYWKELLKL